MSALDGAADRYDVAVVGGGPAGSTVATLLKKYDPGLRVVVLEKERFPRDHIGESQLPAISGVLAEMGVWDKVEAAGFPIKLGASLTWGRDGESWDFDFYPVEEFADEPRPAKFEGQRRFTAFQVDRARYDTILLRHAEEMGAEVREGAQVREVLLGTPPLRGGWGVQESTPEGRGAPRSAPEGRATQDAITGLRLDSGEILTARHYVDASGTVGLFHRALGIPVEAPEELRNIAIWDYWENAEWAVKIGVGGTRIQIRSLPYGWLWFIPMGPTRTSLGLVCPARYYKECGKTPDELYFESVRAEPSIAALTRNATPSGRVQAAKDWSQLAGRIAGPNWLIVGEAAGFADPILSAGMTLAHTSGREAAYTILELDRGEHDPAWLRSLYNDKYRTNIRQHIRFAQFWYASNGCFTELREHCAAIAKEAGLRLSPEEAWRWLAQGGFTNAGAELAQFGSFDVGSAKHLIDKFAGREGTFQFQRYSTLKLNLVGATKGSIGQFVGGGVARTECYRRAGKLLPLRGAYANVIEVLKRSSRATEVLTILQRSAAASYGPEAREKAVSDHMWTLEAMLADGWVVGKTDARAGRIEISGEGPRTIRSTREGMEAIRKRKAKSEERT